MKLLIAATSILLLRDDLSDAVAKLQDGYAFRLDAAGHGDDFSLEGTWVRDAPLVLKSGEYEIVRGKALAWRKKDGEWKRFDPRAGVRADEQQRYALFNRLLRMRAPHAELEAVAKALKDAKKGKDGVVEGTLGAGACLDILAEGRAEPQPAFRKDHAGRAKIWIEKGAVAKVEIVLTWTEEVASNFGVHKNEITLRRTVVVRDVGRAKAEVPEGAKKVIE
jgi:hypothetical protein